MEVGDQVIKASYSPLKKGISSSSPSLPSFPRCIAVSFSPWGTLVNVPAPFRSAPLCS